MSLNINREYVLLALMRTPELRTTQLKNWLLSANHESHPPFNAQQFCTITQTQPNWRLVDQDFAWLNASKKRHLVALSDKAYPEALREIPGAPPLLLAEGNLSLLQTVQLAVVGSRNPTQYGKRLAQDFALALSQRGITVSSGLALGIDAAAHRGALAGSGHTIAVLGSGVDAIYPKSHQGLAEDILSAGGLILSEFPLGTSPLPWHFPKRNRIISGLSQGVLVVEATLGSGSLKTAEHALQQGREIFAIPGSIHSPLSRGCHALIQQGAKLVNEIDDIFTELPNISMLDASIVGDTPPDQGKVNQQTFEISPLLKYIDHECTSLDVLLQGTGLDIGRLSAGLLELELQGYIAGVPGGYIRVA
jgi:DNA processing protein